MARRIVSDFVVRQKSDSDVRMPTPRGVSDPSIAESADSNDSGKENNTQHTVELSMVRKNSKSNRKLLIIVLIIVACVGVGIGLELLFHDSQESESISPIVELQKTVSHEVPHSVSSHIMFVGDVFWGRAIETAAKSSGNGAANLFRGLTSEDKKGYDAWVGDMECPVTDRDISYRTQVDSLIFNCRPEYVTEAAKWFDVMTLANNHMADNGGEWGQDQTRQHLESAGIQYFGNYDVRKETDICEVVAIKARVDDGSETSLPIALCGYQYVGAVQPQDSQLEVMGRYAKVMPVIAMPHMGVEYRDTAEPAKETLYRSMIDHGADVVIGGHPHVVQNSEVYKGRLIAYSTGNFLFDQQILGRETTETLGVGITLTVDDLDGNKAYKTVVDSCRAYHDDCLTALEKSVSKRPAINVAYDFQYYDETSGTPVKASASVSDLIKKRASVETLSGLDLKWE